jgi:hypothetical protein
MANDSDDRKHAVNPVLAELQKRLRLDLNDLADNMAGGSCRDYPSYTNSVGQVLGISRVERHLLDLDFQMDVDD